MRLNKEIMVTDYKTFPEDAKVWVFPSEKKIYKNEIEELEEKLTAFISKWTKNKENFEATFTIQYNRFIVIFASSEITISTETTNELINFIISLQTEYETELMDKMNPCFKQGQYVQYKDLKDFKKLIKDKAVNKKTIVFDNTITNKFEFENYWEVPASESWYGNLFK